MIDTLHPSVLHGVLCALGPTDSIRLASCSKSLNQSIKSSTCHTTLIPILRERLKDACWSLLQARYSISVQNTLAHHISRDYTSSSTFRLCYSDKDKDIVFQDAIFNDRETFSVVFDRYIHANARLQRSSMIGNNPKVRVKKIEKHFARCCEELSRVATAEVICSICRPIVPSHSS